MLGGALSFDSRLFMCFVLGNCVLSDVRTRNNAWPTFQGWPSVIESLAELRINPMANSTQRFPYVRIAAVHRYDRVTYITSSRSIDMSNRVRDAACETINF